MSHAAQVPTTTYRLPDALQTDSDDRALTYLRRYFGVAGKRYTGSFFDDWPHPDSHRFTADDLVAVSFLSVFVPPLAARQLLQQQAVRFTELLDAVGDDRDLADESATIDSSWAAWTLEAEVRRLPGVGRTIASKLCARKRPRLLPIYDTVVGRVTHAEHAQWDPLREALEADGGSLHERLLRLRRDAALRENVSALRVYDVVAWMEGKDRNVEPATSEERLGAALSQLEE